ncbi:carbohydrate ABC transporter permease [Bosea sp. BIWAKO-01]|uniref:carbohydrate ABC transporter permease n=1 Tax=Bosea sp. BIWAKO-01 TaxID=506668 RepID=UPI000853DAA1|nr:sugar ABC transporter permease [Bosea sp. BIWAKO-01]GAU86601.1 multiple sugar ABC transporter membrane-spanning permease protein MsmF [Bosea sp. BIWAKO-01]
MTLALASPAAFAPVARHRALIERLTGLGFALPAFILLLLTILLPLAVLMLLSLTNYEFGGVDMDWVGLANFQKALDDPIIRRSVVNTLLYVAIVVPGGVFGALLIAVMVHRRRRSRSFYEVIYFLPVTSTLIAMATVWQFLLHPSLGPVNGLLKWLGFAPVAFLSEPSTALATLAVIGIWQLLGFNMILFLAGLTAIPRDLYEAADIDGCSSGIDRFLTITWPLLGPTTMFVLVTTMITAFKIFDTVAVMTRGGPVGSTEVLLYNIYLEGFQYFHTGYAAALTFIFLAFILVFSAVQTFGLDKKVHY